MLETLNAIPADPLLKLIVEYSSDKRADKIDLGVGVYRNSKGRTEVMRAVKMAEQRLVDQQESKSYIGLAGDLEFVEEIRQLTFGKITRGENRLTGLQTPGGSAALRLASDLVFKSNPSARVWVGLPCWSNHIPIFKTAGLQVETYSRYEFDSASVDFDSVITSLASASAGDIVLLQGCCDNPTGADFSLKEWKAIADLCNQLELIPLVDFAYQGLGEGLEEDVAGLDILLSRIPEAMITVSCSKNFGLYRERTGALFVLATNHTQANIARTNLFSIARANYSMPPDHGAAIVRMILQNPEERTVWQVELTEMRDRIIQMRTTLVSELISIDERYDYIAKQRGMFSLLPLRPEHIDALRQKHGVYMASNGRINLAGLNKDSAFRFGEALRSVMGRS